MDKKESDMRLTADVLRVCNFTHEQLAEICGVSRSAVSQWVSGFTGMRPVIRKKLETMLAEAERQQES